MTVERLNKPDDDASPRRNKRQPKVHNDRAEINRRNAQKSTGPKSSDGLRRTRMNAIKTGMTAKVIALMPGEDPATLQAEMNAMTSFYGLHDPIDTINQERIVAANRQVKRCESYQAGLASYTVAESEVNAAVGVKSKVQDADVAVELLVARLETDSSTVVPALEATSEGRRFIMAFLDEVGRAFLRAPFGVPPRPMMFKLALLLDPKRSNAAKTFLQSEAKMREIEGELPESLLDFLEEDPNPYAYVKEVRAPFFDAMNSATRLYGFKIEMRNLLRDVVRLQLEYLNKKEVAFQEQRRRLELFQRLPRETRLQIAALPADPKVAANFLRYLSGANRHLSSTIKEFKQHRDACGYPNNPIAAEIDETPVVPPYQAEMPWSALQQAEYNGDTVHDLKLSIAKMVEQLNWSLGTLDVVEGRTPPATVGTAASDAAFSKLADAIRASQTASESPESTPESVAAQNEANRVESVAVVDVAFTRLTRWLASNAARVVAGMRVAGAESAAEPVRTPSDPVPPSKPPA